MTNKSTSLSTAAEPSSNSESSFQRTVSTLRSYRTGYFGDGSPRPAPRPFRCDTAVPRTDTSTALPSRTDRRRSRLGERLVPSSRAAPNESRAPFTDGAVRPCDRTGFSFSLIRHLSRVISQYFNTVRVTQHLFSGSDRCPFRYFVLRELFRAPLGCAGRGAAPRAAGPPADALHGALQRRSARVGEVQTRSPRSSAAQRRIPDSRSRRAAGPRSARSRTREPPGGSRPRAAPRPPPAWSPRPLCCRRPIPLRGRSEFGASVYFRGKAEHATFRPTLRHRQL